MCCDQELFLAPGIDYIDFSFTALSNIILTKLSGSLTSLLLLLLLPLLLLLVPDWLVVSPSLLVLVAATLELEVRVMVGVLVLVNVTGTFTSGEPSSDTVSDHLVPELSTSMSRFRWCQ